MKLTLVLNAKERNTKSRVNHRLINTAAPLLLPSLINRIAFQETAISVCCLLAHQRFIVFNEF